MRLLKQTTGKFTDCMYHDIQKIFYTQKLLFKYMYICIYVYIYIYPYLYLLSSRTHPLVNLVSDQTLRFQGWCFSLEIIYQMRLGHAVAKTSKGCALVTSWASEVLAVLLKTNTELNPWFWILAVVHKRLIRPLYTIIYIYIFIYICINIHIHHSSSSTQHAQRWVLARNFVTQWGLVLLRHMDAFTGR